MRRPSPGLRPDTEASMSQEDRLRIAFVLEDISRSGGMGRVVLEHAERLASDHEVHLVCATIHDLQNPDITVHRIHLPRLPHVLRIPLFAVRSSAAVRRKGFDVILSQGPNCFAQTAMLMHFCAATSRQQMRSLSTAALQAGMVTRVVKQLWFAYNVAVERRLCRRLRGRVIAVSAGLARDIAAAYGLEPSDVHVVANGVNGEEFSPEHRDTLGAEFRAQHGLADAGLVALFVGGDWYRKGLDHAVRALEFVGDRDIHLVVVGPGDQDTFGGLIGSPARSRLHFIGEQRSCRGAYAAADAFVFPSYFEAFPLVVLEAASAGLPLVAAAVNGVEDILSDGDNGFAIRRDPEDIAAKLCQLHDDPALRGRMSQAAREAVDEFSWDAAAQRLAQCLRRTHAARQASP
jgi:glycosyltransferase involved in cell wall biosynthesis